MPKKGEPKMIKGEVCRIPLTPEEHRHSSPPPTLNDITWRIFRIMAEFVEGFQFLSQFEKEVTIFGSARFPSSNKWYKEARRLGHMLAKKGFTVFTGGGPGIMEAGNRGAHEAGGTSVGLNIQLPHEQRINPYVNKGRGFHYFFTRKVMLAASAQAYVFFPGGFGTMDELFEMLTLIQTKKSEHVTVILVGVEFWQGLIDWMRMAFRHQQQTIDEEDLEMFILVDSAEEAFKHIHPTKERTFF